MRNDQQKQESSDFDYFVILAILLLGMAVGYWLAH